MISMFFRRLELMDMIVILYFGVLLIYPYRHAGIRLMFPMMPFLVYYLVRGLETVNIFPNIKKTVKICFLGCLLLLSYLNMFWTILQTDHQVLDGPQEKSAVEAFEYIRNNTAEGDVIIFCEAPGACPVYTQA